MTRTEAIHELSEMKLDAWTDHRQMEALDMAINSLKYEDAIATLDNIEQYCEEHGYVLITKEVYEDAIQTLQRTADMQNEIMKIVEGSAEHERSQ